MRGSGLVTLAALGTQPHLGRVPALHCMSPLDCACVGRPPLRRWIEDEGWGARLDRWREGVQSAAP